MQHIISLWKLIKKELLQIVFIHSPDLEFKEFVEDYPKYLFPVFLKGKTLSLNNPLRFKNNLLWKSY